MHTHLITEALGWSATAVFASSYLCRTQGALRAVQGFAALLWISYGISTGSMPVIASNTAVAFMAVVYPVIRQATDRVRTRPTVPIEQKVKTPAFEELPELS
jgi:hypothetical protein